MNQRINNAHDYAWAEAWVEKFGKALRELKAKPLGDEHPLLRKAQIDSMESVIDGFIKEMHEYRKQHVKNTDNGESGLDFEREYTVGLD